MDAVSSKRYWWSTCSTDLFSRFTISILFSGTLHTITYFLFIIPKVSMMSLYCLSKRIFPSQVICTMLSCWQGWSNRTRTMVLSKAVEAQSIFFIGGLRLILMVSFKSIQNDFMINLQLSKIIVYLTSLQPLKRLVIVSSLQAYKSFMNMVVWVITAYLLALLILLHLTLLFCADDHCVYHFETPPVSTEIGYQIRRAIAALLPYEMRVMQKIAQWIVVGELMMVFLMVIRVASKVICFCIWVFTAVFLTMILVASLSSYDLIGEVKSWNQQQEWVSQDQIAYLTFFYQTVQDRIASLFK